MDVQKFVEPEVNLERLVELLEGMGHEGRYHTVRTWAKADLKRIYAAVKGKKPVTLDHLVPAGTEPLVEVIHDLHNALGLPGRFPQKRFCRLPNDEKELAGWNPHSFQAFSGPGYFLARQGEGDHEGELVIDYTKVPTLKPEQWPAIEKNEGFIPGIVYGGMTDYVRGISDHVAIGEAFKGGKSRNEWFVIVRRDPVG